MDNLRPVTQKEKILFPIVVAIVVILILPDTAPLIGMLMFGNLLKECLVTRQLAETASNALMYIITIMLGMAVGASADRCGRRQRGPDGGPCSAEGGRGGRSDQLPADARDGSECSRCYRFCRCSRCIP